MSKLNEVLNQIENKGYKLLSYTNKEVCYEDNKGYRYCKKYRYIKEINETHKYDIKNIYHIYNIEHMLDLSKSGTKLIQETYKDGKTPMKFICGRCGAEFKATIGSIEKYKYKLCANCVREVQNTKKYKLEEIKKEVESYGYKMLNDNYQDFNSRIDVIDENGYKGKVKLYTLRSGGSISKFALYNPYALDNLKLFCKLNGYDCTIPNQKYQGWEHPLKVECSCGNIYNIDTSKLVNGGQYKCTKCTVYFSYLEDTIDKWLELNNIEHIRQYIIKECKYKLPLPFDFYLPKYNVLIEVQGEQHYKPVDKFGGEKAYRLQIKKDSIKKQYCEYKNIPLIIISYKDIYSKKYIDILKKELNI